MSNNDAPYKSSVVLYLEPGVRNRVFYACVLLILYLTSNQAGLTILQTPMLKSMGMLDQFAIVAIAGTIGTAIMTPIGGKIGDMIGKKSMILIFGVIGIAATVILALFQQFIPYIAMRVLIAIAGGAMISVPYTLIGQVFTREEAPKKMGILSSTIALGSFLGAMIAGFLADANLTVVAILYPVAFLAIGMFFTASSLPNIKSANKSKFDVVGMLLLTITLVSLVLALNFGTKLGWTNRFILGGLALFLVGLILFVVAEKNIEKKGGNPLIAISLFNNMEYSMLLIIGFTGYYYYTMVLNYGSYAAINIMGSSAGAAGTLTLPRTIITMILPAIAGTWVGKKATNSWKAIAIGVGVPAIALIPMLGISASTPLIVLYASFAITGFSESFRAVSITPAAQRLLKPEALATGTALLNFVNTLAGVFAAAIGGSLFGYAGENQVLGIKLIFASAIIVSITGFLLTVAYIRPKQVKRAKEQEESELSSVETAS